MLADQRFGAPAAFEVLQAVGTQQEVAEDGGASAIHVGVGNVFSSFLFALLGALISDGEAEFSRHHCGREL